VNREKRLIPYPTTIWQPYDEDLFKGWRHSVKNQISRFASAALLSATVLSATLLLAARRRHRASPG
jgi:hypothetical protein